MEGDMYAIICPGRFNFGIVGVIGAAYASYSPGSDPTKLTNTVRLNNVMLSADWFDKGRAACALDLTETFNSFLGIRSNKVFTTDYDTVLNGCFIRGDSCAFWSISSHLYSSVAGEWEVAGNRRLEEYESFKDFVAFGSMYFRARLNSAEELTFDQILWGGPHGEHAWQNTAKLTMNSGGIRTSLKSARMLSILRKTLSRQST